MGAASEQSHRISGPRQNAAETTADAAGSEDRDVHGATV
jgi:hypothetical protein